MRPLVTLFIFSYNQEKFIKMAIESALVQEYSPLEIIISDDCSMDNTINIIKSIILNYDGPHTVKFNINPINLGIGEHVNQAFKMAKGEFIIFAAGDDISLPQRVSRIVDRWLALDKKVSAIYSGANLINEYDNECGILKVAIAEMELNTLNLISYRAKKNVHLLMGATSAYAKDLNQPFGDLLPNVNVEDIPLIIRSSLKNGVSYLNEPLVLYRQNVSVWLPRKLKNEGFVRHRERMLYRIKVNYYVAKQIYHDVQQVYCDNKVNKASEQRLIETEFVQQCIEKRKFLLFCFLKNLSKTSNWLEMLFPAIIVSNPYLHRLIYSLYGFFKGG
ncbi:glycosyltransferase [Acinetobacter brisouii]|uniref:glycosyltransferase n=1 Tax=Acinetobacter brisouii TaxID=396323 RepID=UPI000695FB89|nr:glycosyltransferase [Acinetobacter brisouii]